MQRVNTSSIKYQIGSIIGFDGVVQFRVSDLKNTGKCVTLLNRARNDGCGQPCILMYEEA